MQKKLIKGFKQENDMIERLNELLRRMVALGMELRNQSKRQCGAKS